MFWKIIKKIFGKKNTSEPSKELKSSELDLPKTTPLQDSLKNIAILEIHSVSSFRPSQPQQPVKPQPIMSPYFQMVWDDGWGLLVEVMHIDPFDFLDDKQF